jgi:hypothetical protein
VNTLAVRESTDARGQECFLRPFLLALREKSIRYCVLHSYEQLPFYTESDVDMALHGISREEFESLLQRVAREAGWEIVQRLWYDVPTCFCYVVRSLSEPRAWIAVDILLDPIGIGCYGLETEILTRDAIADGIFFRSNPSVEFCYKLTKRIHKGQFKPSDLAKLNVLYREADKSLMRRVLSQRYGAWVAHRILAVFEQAGDVGVRLPSVRVLSMIQLLKQRHLPIPRLLKRLAWQARRTWNRVSQPTGVVLWLPWMSEMALQQLSETLWTRVGPAFGRLRVEPISGPWRRFAALSCKTLLVCVDADNLDKPRVQPTMFAHKTPDDNASAERRGSLVDQAEDAVLKVLRSRMARRLPLSPERTGR